jgi:hypothetical protein
MQDTPLDQPQNLPTETKAIDDFFKAYVIFYSISLFISFILSLFNAPDNSFIKLFFSALTIAIIAFHVIYSILLIAKKKGAGRIIVHLLNSFSMLVLTIGLIFYFAHWEYSSEMLSTSLMTIPFLMLVQLIYELVVRKDISKFTYVISFAGISTFAFGVLFFMQKWPYGRNMLAIGGIVTIAMMIVHFNLSIKKETKYQIHIRYLMQCIFAIITAIMILVNHSLVL